MWQSANLSTNAHNVYIPNIIYLIIIYKITRNDVTYSFIDIGNISLIFQSNIDSSNILETSKTKIILF